MDWDLSFSLYQRFCCLLPTWMILQSVLPLVTSLKWMTPVIPLHRGMGEQDTPTETFSVMCAETGSFVGDLIAVLRTKFHVMDSFKKGHTSLIIESSLFWLSLRLVFKWIRCETSFFRGDKEATEPSVLDSASHSQFSAGTLITCSVRTEQINLIQFLKYLGKNHWWTKPSLEITWNYHRDWIDKIQLKAFTRVWTS